MKKLMVFGLSLVVLVLFVLFANLVLAVRINEVELNPEGTDSGREWIELYSEQEVNLSSWSLENKDNDKLILNETFQGYLIINFEGQWLDNSNEKITLKDNNRDIVDETIDLDDSHNDNRTWQYCNGNWIFENTTENSANLCEEENGNETQNESQQENSEQEAEISLGLEWDENEIINGENFKIELQTYNLKDEKYDIKVYIENDGKIISERYDENENEWKSGTYYIREAIEGKGNKSEDFKLRIKEKYGSFSGNGEIIAKIRKSGSSSVIDEIKEDIEILEKEEEKEEKKEEIKEEQETIKENQEQNKETVEQTRNVIRLGDRSKLQEENEEKSEGKILYESESEKVKKYAIYAFNIVLIIIIIFLLTSFKKKGGLKGMKKR